jgi:signal peptidase I
MLTLRDASSKNTVFCGGLTTYGSVDTLSPSREILSLETGRLMNRDTRQTKKLGPATRDLHKLRKEPFITQIASFVDLFVWLLVLKSFFLPLFIIPTGSMAQTLHGAHASYTCPNCGYEYDIGFHTPAGPDIIQCPNCRYQQETWRPANPDGVRLRSKSGDRIVVHGWPFQIGGRFAPRRWDVVVFKNPNEPSVNYIKRLIGLPGETIEIIDGDVWVKGRDEESLHLARKTQYAQRSLWFPYYDHDYPPKEGTDDWAGRRGFARKRWSDYHPRWAAQLDRKAWTRLDTRTPHFDGLQQPHSEVLFVTSESDTARPAPILDIYGYDGYAPDYDSVTDVRLSTDLEIEDGDGYVELSISKYSSYFYARLYADGRLTLERRITDSAEREMLGETRISLPPHLLRFALGHADYRVAIEIDGVTRLASTPTQYNVTPEIARRRSRMLGGRSHSRVSPTIRIAAERVRASFAHLRIDRDVYYTSGNLRARTVEPGSGKPGTGTQGHPITLRDDAYFMCGDNSPQSHDSRAWSAAELGPHLRAAYEEGRYDIGTVPADQMIGRAFLVYWPGFMPLSDRGPNLLPDLGRVRWIH